MRLQKVFTGTINTNEINFRILGGKTSDLIENTRCRSRSSNTITNNQRPLGGHFSY